MNLFILFAVALSTYTVVDAGHWALLVAGSSGYRNYRHQADVCHAYHMLRQHGVPEKHIIVMMRDDIANHPYNPFNGTIAHSPNGPDVYRGVVKDYVGNDVKANYFLQILKGNRTAMYGIGSGKVIDSNVYDNIFIYFTNHGARRQLLFPDSSVFEYELRDVIEKMHQKRQYNKMVFYLDTSYGGSVFHEKTFPSYMNVLTVSSTGEEESNYAVFYDKARGTYLGNLFTVNWLYHSDLTDSFNTTVGEQIAYLQKATKASHVTTYGDELIKTLLLNQIQGPFESLFKTQYELRNTFIRHRVPTWTVPYMVLWYQFSSANRSRARLILQKMEQIVQKNIAIAKSMMKVAIYFKNSITNLRKFNNIPLTKEQQMCFKYVSDGFRRMVSPSTFEYAVQHLHVFENLCIAGHPADGILESVRAVYFS